MGEAWHGEIEREQSQVPGHLKGGRASPSVQVAGDCSSVVRGGCMVVTAGPQRTVGTPALPLTCARSRCRPCSVLRAHKRTG